MRFFLGRARKRVASTGPSSFTKTSTAFAIRRSSFVKTLAFILLESTRDSTDHWLSDCHLHALKIHDEGFASQQFGADQYVLGVSRNAIDRSTLPVKDDLSKEDFLFHRFSRGDLEFFSSDSKPFAPHQQVSRHTQVAVEAGVDDRDKFSWAGSEQQLN